MPAFLLCIILCFGITGQAQKKALNATWRYITDYQTALSDGRFERPLLLNALNSIQSAQTQSETAVKALTWSYAVRVNALLFGFKIDSIQMQFSKAGKTITQEQILNYYALLDSKYLFDAWKSWIQFKRLDPKSSELFKTDFQNDDNTELKRILSRMRIDASNLANVMYQNKSYEMASQAFEMSYELYFDMTSMYDTISWNNACIAALNSKNTTRSKRFLEHGITQQWDQISFYSMLSRLYLEQGDTNQALQWLTNGRSRYPSDLGLISEETNLYIAQKNISQAKTNLQLAISKAPQQSNLILVLANILDNEVQQLQVGPGMPAYDTLWKATEALYLKAFQLLPERSDQQFALLFNLGALYNNHAVKWSQLKTPKGQNALQFSKQIEQQAAVFLNKALPYLERALTIKPDDEAVKRALKQIYLKTGKADKAKML
ncbi:MAG: tetratricopeptide repeat protein [Bacteroidia bacterium]|jgi:tetratricopeptide (TPR) repeat protein|nr:hypothetical protein [Bacteroidia bacterium]